MLSHIDRPAIKAVALYILKRTGKIDLHKLSKIMYFAQMKHLSRYGRPIADENFVAMQDGPVPINLYISTRKKKTDDINGAFKKENYMIEGIEEPDMDELSATDIVCIEESISENSHLSWYKLRLKSHGYAYENAKKKDESSNKNPIDIFDIAKEGGADEGMLEYIKEMQELRNFANGAQYC